MKMNYYLAIDIGASSGRHILGHVENGRMILEEIYRFDNLQIHKNGHDCWDIEHLFTNVKAGIAKCRELGKLPTTLGIDTWGVDYVLVDKSGTAICDAVAYRDKRTVGMREKLEKIIPFETLYRKTGIQYQPYNTIYQLFAHKLESPEDFERAERFLMMPEYLGFLLTGVMKNEYTNASTTALLSAERHVWDDELIEKLGIPRRIFGEPMPPMTTLGSFRPEVAEELGFDCTVILPATHDTGSAFMAVPARDKTSVYISSGTWSLLGVENDKPLTGNDSMKANFSNEGGFGYRFRYLKNIMGLWMIQSIRRELNGQAYVQNKQRADAHAGERKWSYAELEAAARENSDFATVIDIDRESFLAPDSMIDAVRAECERVGAEVPTEVGELMQCVYKSLADKYARSVKELEALTGVKYTGIHIVGGGSKDGYLSELTAAATGLPVYTGPAEGTALGNLMAQFIKAGEFTDLEEARSAIYDSFEITEVNTKA